MRPSSGTVVAVSCHGEYSFTKPTRDRIVLMAGLGVEGDVHAGVHVRHRSRVRADPSQPNLRQVHLMPAELFAEVDAKGYAVAAGDLGENVTTAGIDLLGLPTGTVLRFGSTPAGSEERPAAVAAGPAVAASGGAVAGGGGAGAAGGAAAPGALEAVAGLLAAAAAVTLDAPTAVAIAAVEAAARRDRGGSVPTVVLAGLRNPCGQINGFRPGLLKEVIGRDSGGRLVRRAGVMAIVLRGGPIWPGDDITVELPPPPYVRLERV